MIDNHAGTYNMSEFFSHKSKIYYRLPDK